MDLYEKILIWIWIMFIDSRLCGSNDMDLRKKILYESHNTVFTMHLGGIRCTRI